MADVDAARALDILAFGAHPDDTDIGCAGILATHARLGKRVGVCDLTQAELSSNGSTVTRRQESLRAAEALGLTVRLTLSLPDRGLAPTDDAVNLLVNVLRTWRPSFVLAPDWEDRHPDHRACAGLVEEAVFNAGLRRIATDGKSPHRVNQVLYYYINGIGKPDVAVDITAAADCKKAALSAYGSQFDAGRGRQPTPLNQGFVDAILGRDAITGHQVGVRYAEGLRSKRPLSIRSLDRLGLD